MSIQHHLGADGSFVCGDTESGLTAYAYPTSTHAVAARKNPERVAAEMIRNEAPSPNSLKQRADYDARNWETLNASATKEAA